MSIPPQVSRSRAYASLAATILAWSTVPLILRYFSQHTHLDAWTVNGIRYAFTVLFWLPYVVWSFRTDPEGCKGVWAAGWLPALFHLLGQIGWGLAPYFNEASVMNFVSRISFLCTMLVGFWLLREERHLARRPLFWVGVSITVVGLCAMFEGGRHIGNTSGFGMGLLVWSATCWAFYACLVRRRMQAYPARLGFGVVSLMVMPGLLVLMFTVGDWRQAALIGPTDWFLLALSAWVGIALGHVLFYQAVRALGPIVSEGSLALIPFVTALLAGWLMDEHMVPAQWIGGTLLVMASLFLLTSKRVAAEEPSGH